MLFTGKIDACKVRAFGCLVQDGTRQMTVLDFVVKLGKHEVSLILPVPRESELVPTYAGHLDDVALCFDDVMTEQVFEAAQRHRTDVTPRYFGDLASLGGAVFCPDSVSAFLRTHYDSGFSFWVLSFTEDTHTGPLSYTHPARADKRLFLPGRSTEHLFGEAESDDVSYDYMAFTVNTTSSAGVLPFTRRIHTAFRWDLIKDLTFPEIANLHMFSHTGTHPNSDIFFMSTDTPTDQRIYLGGDGSVFRDKTRLRIVQYFPCGLRTFPVVNGAYLTSPGEPAPFHFGGAECMFEEALFPGTRDWAIKITDEVGTDSPCVLWVKPWEIRHELGKSFLDLIE